MAQPARSVEARPASPEDPPVDPFAIEQAYRQHRARRAARAKRHREKRWAGIRFWFVLLVGIAVAVFLATRTLGEIERVFGL